jgi:hypothetical protein
MNQSKAEQWLKAHPTYQHLFLVGLITLFGALLRWKFLTGSTFPVNDGGMFYSMVNDLIANHFRLPLITTYNQAGIPFTYPPLSFYILGFLHQTAGIDLLALFKYYGVIFNLLSIPAFFLLARELTGRRDLESYAATAFYAFLVSGYDWLIAGGGVTRSPAHTFMILALALYLLYLRTGRRWYWIGSAVCGGLIALHHLEYLWLFCLTLLIFNLTRENLLRRLLNLAGYFLLIGLISAPWWISVLQMHGLSPFLTAFASKNSNWLNSLNLILTLKMTAESQSSYINSLALIGIFFCLLRRSERRNIAWLALVIVLGARSLHRSALFPVAVLAGIGLGGIFAGLQMLASKLTDFPKKSTELILAFFVIFSLVHPLINSYYTSFTPQPALRSLSQAELDSMAWVRQNTAAGSTFLVLDPNPDWFTSQYSEWFPTQTGRISLGTVQGTEWLPQMEYIRRMQLYEGASACLNRGSECVATLLRDQVVQPEYLVVTHASCRIDPSDCTELFLQSLQKVGIYLPIYSNPSVVIFAIPE